MKPLLVAACLTLCAGPGSAALLNLDTRATPVIDFLADVTFLETGGVGDLLFDAPALAVVTGADVAGDLYIEFSANFDMADPYGSFNGALFSHDDAGDFLSGDLVGLGFEEDRLQMLFANLTGSGAGVFGERTLVDFYFFDPVGADPVRGLSDGGSYTIAGTAMAPVPLPVGLPMLGGGLIALVLLRRCRG